MTPFGIRKKVKKLIGRGGPPVIEQFPVTFILPDGSEHTIEAEKHYTLVMASQMLPRPINTGCPDGSCGKCVVDALDPTGLSPMKDNERKVIDDFVEDKKDTTRLACHARVMGPGARVQVHELYDFDAITGP